MSQIEIVNDSVPAMSASAIETVRKLESYTLQAPQTKIPTSHIFHAGVYARTIMIPAGVILTGALIKIATMLIVQGDCIVYIGDQARELHGYHVLAASPGRKQAFIAIKDTHMTMFFSTNAKNVEQAEDEFTDEANLLFSRAADAINYITAGD